MIAYDQKLIDLMDYVQYFAIDIMCLQETHSNDKNRISSLISHHSQYSAIECINNKTERCNKNGLAIIHKSDMGSEI